jgi:hypothetical protein
LTIALQALLEALEPQLQLQLPRIPTDTLASGLWAMSRLQLQPSADTIAAVAAHLQLPPDQQGTGGGAEAGHTNSSSSSSNVGRSNHRAYSSSSNSRLALCSARTFGGLCYSLNFFMLRDLGFWAAAAAAGRQHLAELKPTGISNLLQGLAASGWLVDPAPIAEQQQQQQQPPGGLEQAASTEAAAAAGWSVDAFGSSGPSSTAATDVRDHKAPAGPSAVAHEQQTAVTALLQAVEQLILAQPHQLQRWRMRDISQMCQAYALMGYNCSPLFAVVANHLLEYGPGSSSSSSSGGGFRASNSSTSRGSSSATYPSGYPGQDQRLHRPQQQQQQQWSMQASVLTAASNGYGSSSSSQYADRRGPRRLAECRPSDAAGLVWAYVAAFCPHRLLLQELAPVLAACAGQLHAADCCRLLWAYSTAGVADARMLAAVTAATAEEMHGVLPRTAAGAIWSLAQMRFEAPAFMEAALDRLAVCLEATPVDIPGSSTSSSKSGSSSGTPASVTQQHASPPSASAGSAAARIDSTNSSGSSAADRPSVLQQLLQGSSAALLSGGPEARSTPAGELSMLGMMHRRRRIRSSSSQQQQQQHSADSLQQQQQRNAANSGNGSKVHSTSSAAAAGVDEYCDDLMLQEEQQQWQQLSDLDEEQQQQQQRVRVPHMAGEPVHCSHRDVAQAVYACGRLQHYNGAFFRVLRSKLPGLLPGFSDVQLVEVLWGLAQLNLYDGPNMEAAAAEVGFGAGLGVAWSGHHGACVTHAQADN